MKQTWTVLILTATGILHTGSSQAEFVGINIGSAYWSSGSFNNNNNGSPIDLSDDPGITDDSQAPFVLTLEHALPVLPNIRYQSFALDSNDSSTSASNFNINGKAVSSGNQVRSNFNLLHDDIVLYYQLLDNWINLDMGIDLKLFNGEVEAGGDTATRVEVDETIPLLYLSARFDLPYPGFYIDANFNNLNLGDTASTVEDSSLKLGYESSYGLGFEGGIKTFSLELGDTSSPDTDYRYDGVFLNGYYNF